MLFGMFTPVLHFSHAREVIIIQQVGPGRPVAFLEGLGRQQPRLGESSNRRSTPPSAVGPGEVQQMQGPIISRQPQQESPLPPWADPQEQQQQQQQQQQHQHDPPRQQQPPWLPTQQPRQPQLTPWDAEPAAMRRPLVVLTQRGSTHIRQDIPDRPCPACQGTGKVLCGNCRGKGRVNFRDEAMLPRGAWPEWCPCCRASGRWYCERCMGTGVRREPIGFRLAAEDSD